MCRLMLLLVLVHVCAITAVDVDQTKNVSYFEAPYPKNCKQILETSATSGIYTIKPDFSPEPFVVYCDMDLSAGGWLYIINRKDGTQNFSRPWEEYKTGFGNIADEFWLGLEYIHHLTVDEINELLIELVDWKLERYYIHYDAFSVAGEVEDYRLQVVDGYTGTLQDCFTYHGGQKFSTIDRDNDELINQDCSLIYGRSGWWFKDCSMCLLTGNYQQEAEAIAGNSRTGITWFGYDSNNLFYSFKEARMMIRPRPL